MHGLEASGMHAVQPGEGLKHGQLVGVCNFECKGGMNHREWDTNPVDGACRGVHHTGRGEHGVHARVEHHVLPAARH